MLLLVGIFIIDVDLFVNITWIFFRLIFERFLNLLQLYILIFLIRNSSLCQNSSRPPAPNAGIQVKQTLIEITIQSQ